MTISKKVILDGIRAGYELHLMTDGECKLLDLRNNSYVEEIIDKHDRIKVVNYGFTDGVFSEVVTKHDLIAECFLGKKDNQKVIHINFNVSDSNINNLKVVSADEYRKHYIKSAEINDEKMKSYKKQEKHEEKTLQNNEDVNYINEKVIGANGNTSIKDPFGKKITLDRWLTIEEKKEIVSELLLKYDNEIHNNWDSNPVRYFLDGLSNYLINHDDFMKSKQVLSRNKLRDMNHGDGRTISVEALNNTERENAGLDPYYTN